MTAVYVQAEPETEIRRYITSPATCRCCRAGRRRQWTPVATSWRRHFRRLPTMTSSNPFSFDPCTFVRHKTNFGYKSTGEYNPLCLPIN